MVSYLGFTKSVSVCVSSSIVLFTTDKSLLSNRLISSSIFLMSCCIRRILAVSGLLDISRSLFSTAASYAILLLLILERIFTFSLSYVFSARFTLFSCSRFNSSVFNSKSSFNFLILLLYSSFNRASFVCNSSFILLILFSYSCFNSVVCSSFFLSDFNFLLSNISVFFNSLATDISYCPFNTLTVFSYLFKSFLFFRPTCSLSMSSAILAFLRFSSSINTSWSRVIPPILRFS